VVILTTSDDQYIEPLRVKVVFNDRKDTITYYTFDSFVYPNTINIMYVDVSLGIGQTGTFKIEIEDSAKAIDYHALLAMKIYIYAGKTQQSYTPLIVGVIRSVEQSRDDTGLQTYILSGYGLAIVFNETVVNWRKSAFRQSLDSLNPSLQDISHEANNLVRHLVTSRDVFPLQNSESIIERYNLSADGIDIRVKDFLSTVNEQNVESSHTMNLLSNAVGGMWGVDRFGRVFYKYAQFEYSPIVVKDTVESTDLADRTSYFAGPWKRLISIKKEDGFSNRLFAKTSSQTIETFIELNSQGSTPLLDKAAAQMWVPSASKFTNMGFLLRKVGDPKSTPRNIVQGRIVHDNGGYPTGAEVISFTIPIEDIKRTPTPIYQFDINFAGVDVTVGQKYWVILFRRGSNNKNYVEWLHNNDFSTNTEAINRVSAISDPNGDYSSWPGLRWNLHTSGPVYAFATFDSLSHLVYAEDPVSVDRYGPIENFIDVRGLDDNRTIDKYLHTYLQFSARPIIFYTINRVTIPDSLFMPGQLITIVDNLGGMERSKNISAEIQEVRYEFNVAEDGLGTRFCEIRPLGYYDHLFDLEGVCS